MAYRIIQQQDGSLTLLQDHTIQELDDNYLMSAAGPREDRKANLKQATAH